MTIKKITVLGAGIMGSGIAHVSAAGGFVPSCLTSMSEILKKAQEQIRANMQKAVELKKTTPEEMQAAMSRLSVTETSSWLHRVILLSKPRRKESN